MNIRLKNDLMHSIQNYEQDSLELITPLPGHPLLVDKGVDKGGEQPPVGRNQGVNEPKD